MKIEILTIPHSEQKYETCGDWYFEGDTLKITVSEMGDWRYSMLVAFHEMAEALMCKNDGVSEKDVTNFDLSFETMRQENPKIVGDVEPGNMESAPYHEQHKRATNLESLLAMGLDVRWAEYNKKVNSLHK